MYSTKSNNQGREEGSVKEYVVTANLTKSSLELKTTDWNKSYKINQLSGDLIIVDRIDVTVDKRVSSLHYWQNLAGAKGSFVLSFSDIAELDRFCAMRSAQKLEIQYTTEKNKRVQDEKNNSLIQKQSDPQEYALDENKLDLYTFELDYYSFQLGHVKGNDDKVQSNHKNITFDASTGKLSHLDTAFDLGQYCQCSPRTMRDMEKVRKSYLSCWVRANTWYSKIGPLPRNFEMARDYFGIFILFLFFLVLTFKNKGAFSVFLGKFDDYCKKMAKGIQR
jgi:hypothetical protein